MLSLRATRRASRAERARALRATNVNTQGVIMPHPTEAACLNHTSLSPDKPLHPGLETVCAVCSGILSGTASRFGALLNGVRTLDRKASELFEPRDERPRQAAEALHALLPLPETGSLLHFEAGDGAFLEAFHTLRPGWELSATESGDAFMELIRKDFLRSAHNGDYRDADIAQHYDLIVVTRPLDELARPLHAVRWLSRRLAPNGILYLWQPAPARTDTSLCGAVHGLAIRVTHLNTLCKAAGLSVGEVSTEGHAVRLCARKNGEAPARSAGSPSLRASDGNASPFRERKPHDSDPSEKKG